MSPKLKRKFFNSPFPFPRMIPKKHSSPSKSTGNSLPTAQREGKLTVKSQKSIVVSSINARCPAKVYDPQKRRMDTLFVIAKVPMQESRGVLEEGAVDRSG